MATQLNVSFLSIFEFCIVNQTIKIVYRNNLLILKNKVLCTPFSVHFTVFIQRIYRNITMSVLFTKGFAWVVTNVDIIYANRRMDELYNSCNPCNPKN